MGFFCFPHIAEQEITTTTRYSFAFKPPGPLSPGALDELMLNMCKGPHLPDVALVVGVKEDQSCNLLAELQSESANVAQQRLAARIPLIYVEFSLHTGRAKLKLIDSSFKNRISEFKSVVESDPQAWIQSGLKAAFDSDQVILRAPPGYSYQKPSGARSDIFLKPDLAFTSSVIVSFIAFALFVKIFSNRVRTSSELTTVFVDTMAISPVAYALRDFLQLCGSQRPYKIESFHSYGGMENVDRPLRGTSLCLISASASMSMQEQWTLTKQVSSDEVITLLTLTSAKNLKERALLVLEPPDYVQSAGPAQLSIRIKGESFLPEQELAKKVLLTDKDHRSDKEVSAFHRFAGANIFDIWRRPGKSDSKLRALYVDGSNLVTNSAFKSWLEKRLNQSVKAITRAVIYQDDSASLTLANLVKEYCEKKLGAKKLMLIAAHQIDSIKMEENAGVIVCAAVVGKGSLLLEISRALRDKHIGPRLYVIGFQVTDSRGELATLESNLKHSKNIPHEVARYGKAAIGTQLAASYDLEKAHYYATDRHPTDLPGLMKARATTLGTIRPCGELALLPHGSTLSNAMKLRPGFAYWPNEFEPQTCHAEVLGTVAVLLQRAREHEDLPEERRLHASSFRHVVLHPENFTRFNDGILQASILRCAYPSELDYRSDNAASEFMKALIMRSLAKSDAESGEAALEFLLALMQKRLQLREAHYNEVRALATRGPWRSTQLGKAMQFITQDATQMSNDSKMPF
jgi:hypothetical protein